MGFTQFSIPDRNIPELIRTLRQIALKHDLKDYIQESQVPDTLVCFQQGDTSFTRLGARKYGGKILVDVCFRSAGIGGELYGKLRSEVEAKLRHLYGDSLSVEDNPQKIIQAPLNDG
jgi:hypothetical protein